jgi:predicted nucleotidyltransferase component of viral defense system
MNKDIKNIGASIRARLTNIALQNRRDFNALLLQYFQERFLYRLSTSPYKRNFVLKGALLFIVYEMPFTRPTKDVDFLALSISNNLQDIEKIVKEISRIDVKDGVVFNTESLSIERIIEEADYEGVRIKLEGSLVNARNTLQIDIAFGDVLVAGPVEKNYPVLLEDQPIPILQIYSKESSVAEKFEAIVRLNIVTSRMKDFYDILFMAKHVTFHMRTLREAIDKTFKNRMTPLEDRKAIFSKDFKTSKEKQEQWTAFLSRSRLDSYKTFTEAVEKLELFMEPASKESISDKDMSWSPETWKWE